MDLMHRCGFCGWERGEGSETMLEPLCEQCGCVLEARAATAGTPVAAVESRGLVAARRVAVILLLLGIVPVVLVAAKAGV